MWTILKGVQNVTFVCEAVFYFWKGSQWVGMSPECFCGMLLSAITMILVVEIAAISNREVTRFSRTQITPRYRHRLRKIYNPAF